MKKLKRAKKNWTKEEKEYLLNNWGDCSIKFLARRLGRTVTAIKVKSCRIGLRRMIHAGEYVTLNQLAKMLNKKHIDFMPLISKYGMPVEHIQIIKKYVRIIYMNKFWRWLEQNRQLLDFSKTNEYSFGYEPEWVREKRRADKLFKQYKNTPWTKAEDDMLLYLLAQYKYGYREISIKLKRTEGAIKRRMIDLKTPMRPNRAGNHTPWTDAEISKVQDMFKKGYKSVIISE